MSSTARGVLKRMGICMLIGVAIGLLISEGSFRLLRNETDRPSKEITLVIPAGTADAVARGESNPALPENMIFMTGDTLLVRNEDSVSHQLGPVYVPPDTTTSLALTQPDNYAYACSFQPSRYLGLDVRAAVDPTTRAMAILAVGLPTGMLLGAFSFALYPLDGKKKNEGLAHG